MTNALLLFAGVGGTSKACRDLGMSTVSIEREAAPVASLRANGFMTARLDVKHLTRDGWANRIRPSLADVLIGGPPCQPFSQAASDSLGEYDPRDCIPDFIAAVRELQPRFFIMEEVQTLTWPKNAAYLARVLADLRAAGYVVDHRVLDMSDYGVPQARKRLFVLGVRLDRVVTSLDFPAPVRWPVKRGIKVTMAEALGWDAAQAWEANRATPHPGGGWEWVFGRPAPTVVGSYRPDVAAKPGWRKPGDGPRQNTPGSVVTTLEERLVLQGFPRDWKVEGSTAKRDLQVGNSCPPPMVRQLLEANRGAWS